MPGEQWLEVDCLKKWMKLRQEEWSAAVSGLDRFWDFWGGKRLPKFNSYFSLLGLWGGTLRLRRLRMHTQTAFRRILLGLIDAERDFIRTL